MIQKSLKTENARCICPECKNTVDLSRYPNLAPGMVIECEHCGMTLGIKGVAADGTVTTSIVEEGK